MCKLFWRYQVMNRCNDLRSKINQLTDGEYAVAKRDVDRLRQELGQLPLRSIQDTLEEKTTQWASPLTQPTLVSRNYFNGFYPLHLCPLLLLNLFELVNITENITQIWPHDASRIILQFSSSLCLFCTLCANPIGSVYNRYLNERRLNGNESQITAGLGKRPASELPDGQLISSKRPRGRPKGSKNKVKPAEVAWVFLTPIESGWAMNWTC